MTWQQYVEFTATTALPIASDPDYLRFGVLEEAYEALEAYSACCAAIHGKQKRVLRGDAPNVLQAKDEAIAVAKRRLVEELGDLAWYMARMSAQKLTRHVLPPARKLGGGISHVANALVEFGDFSNCYTAMTLLVEFLTLSGIHLNTVIEENVAKLTARKSAGTIQGEGTR